MKNKGIQAIVMKVIKTGTLIGLLFLLATNLSAQKQIFVQEIVSPSEIVIFYVGDFRFDDASSNPLIFKYRLAEASGQPATVQIDFRMTATVPLLGLNNEEILHAQTNVFTFNNPITISNRDIDDRTATRGYILDERGNKVDFDVPVQDMIESDLQQELQDAVLQAGKLPAGIYTFSLTVTSPECLDCITYNFDNPKIIEIQNPSTLDLIAPGGYPGDFNTIFTTYPFFLWESQGCEYFIRISEYNENIHGSPEVAFANNAVLPFPDDGGYYPSPERPGQNGLKTTLFQYPISGAKPLIPGKSYVWSVKKTCVTTSGFEEILSDLWSFTIFSADSDTSAAAAAAAAAAEFITDPVIMQLKLLFGDEKFTELFGENGELSGFDEHSDLILDGQQVDVQVLADLVKKVLAGEISEVKVEVQ